MKDSRQPSEGETPPVKVPVLEERIQYEKQRHQTGKVQITKKVREETVEVDEPVTYEKVEIERVPLNQYLDENPPPIRYEGEVMIVSVVEEVVVKRLLLVEELRIRKIVETESNKKEITLRKETVQIQRDQEKN